MECNHGMVNRSNISRFAHRVGERRRLPADGYRASMFGSPAQQILYEQLLRARSPGLSAVTFDIWSGYQWKPFLVRVRMLVLVVFQSARLLGEKEAVVLLPRCDGGNDERTKMTDYAQCYPATVVTRTGVMST